MNESSRRDPYRRLAAVYDRLLEPMNAGVRRIALGLVPPEQGWSVLDVGCGTGTGLVPYVEAGCRAVGVDVSPAMLRRAESRLGARAELHLTAGGPLPFDGDGFDLVMTSLVLHEIDAGDRPGLLAEMARVATPEGRIVVVDFRFGSRRGWKGPFFAAANTGIERISGHYDGFRSFRAGGGVPPLAADAGLTVLREKIVAGGNLAVYVLAAR
jgi:ubiquinone/menaquinone biosynthesis C-methylase UbiE